MLRVITIYAEMVREKGVNGYEGEGKYTDEQDIMLSVLTSGMLTSAERVNNSSTTSVFPIRAAQHNAVLSFSPLALISKLQSWDCTSTRLPSLAAV